MMHPRSFLAGPRALVGSFADGLRRPSYWPYLLAPSILFGFLAAAAIAVAWFGARPALSNWIDGDPAGGWYRSALVWVATFGLAAFGVLVALLATPPLASPILERLVSRVEREIGATPRPPLGLWTEVVLGIRAQALALCFGIPIWILLTVVDFVVPIAAPVTTLGRGLVMAFGMAWTLIDYPLTLRGVGAATRLRLVGRAWPALFGFGAAFALVFWVPCMGLFTLGTGVMAATRLVYALAGVDEEWRAALAPAQPQPLQPPQPPSVQDAL